jgi:hypothetical protein
MTTHKNHGKTLALAAAVLGSALAMPALAANMVLNNVDAPGVGFNDTTPATPVGGNTGTTVGQQRLVAYQRALELWGKTLRSQATLVVQGSFARLTCDAGSGTLAQAGALQIFSDFPGAPLPGHWYGVALANALAGQDLTPGPPDPGPLAEPFNDDIVANFNGDVGQPDCIAGPGWYYGLDNNAPAGQVDFLDTFMHEVAHGLGFQNFASETTGTTPDGLPDAYMAHTLDLTTSQRWNTMTAGEVAASAVRNGKVVWAGPQVTANAPLVLGPYEGIRFTGGLTKEVEYGASGFGPPASAANFRGAIVVGSDAGGTTTACTPITAPVSGKIAYVDRGVCAFAVKVKNAQDAGAIGVIIGNNAPGSGAFSPGGGDPLITIPSIGISNADGVLVKGTVATVTVDYFIDPTRRAGAAEGYVRLYAPTTVAPGSSISHFDTAAVPNLLMEPFITTDLRSARSVDLTSSLLQDVGWSIETLKIGRCDTRVPSVLRTGQMLHANVDACRAASSHRGQFLGCMTNVVKEARKQRLLADWQQLSILFCSALPHHREHDHWKEGW